MAARVGRLLPVDSTICLPFAVYVRIRADSRAAKRVRVAGVGALALRDLSIGRTFSPTDHPMAVDLGPIDGRLACRRKPIRH